MSQTSYRGLLTSGITSRAQGLELLSEALLEQKWKLMPHDCVNQGPKVPGWASYAQQWVCDVMISAVEWHVRQRPARDTCGRSEDQTTICKRQPGGGGSNHVKDPGSRVI